MTDNDIKIIEKLYRFFICESTSEDIHNKIIDFIEGYENSGFAGDCGVFSIKLREYLGYGEYYAAINPRIWELGEYWLGHVALMVDNTLYDVDGEIEDLERFKSWGQVDIDSNEADLYNLTEDECYESEIVNISHLWGNRVEDMIKEYTACNI
jgi:hypothetical protein